MITDTQIPISLVIGIKKKFKAYLVKHFTDNFPYFHPSFFYEQFFKEIGIENSKENRKKLSSTGNAFLTKLKKEGRLKLIEPGKWQIILDESKIDQKWIENRNFLQYLQKHWRDHYPWYNYKKIARDYLYKKSGVQPQKNEITPFFSISRIFTRRLIQENKIVRYNSYLFKIIEKSDKNDSNSQ